MRVEFERDGMRFPLHSPALAQLADFARNSVSSGDSTFGRTINVCCLCSYVSRLLICTSRDETSLRQETWQALSQSTRY